MIFMKKNNFKLRAIFSLSFLMLAFATNSQANCLVPYKSYMPNIYGQIAVGIVAVPVAAVAGAIDGAVRGCYNEGPKAGFSGIFSGGYNGSAYVVSVEKKYSSYRKVKRIIQGAYIFRNGGSAGSTKLKRGADFYMASFTKAFADAKKYRPDWVMADFANSIIAANESDLLCPKTAGKGQELVAYPEFLARAANGNFGLKNAILPADQRGLLERGASKAGKFFRGF
jgi:hypothetical protein